MVDVLAAVQRALPLRVVAVVACLLAVAAMALPAAGAAAQEVDDDPAVVEARAREASERAAAEATALALDEAAGAYERANAHQIRLSDEVDERRDDVELAGDRTAAAEAAFARSVAESYKQSGGDAALAEAVVLAPDTATALHRAALLERLAASEQERLDRVREVAARTADDSRQHDVVRAGVAAAVADARQEADGLAAALALAEERVADAGRDVASAEDAARQRIEEERRRAEAQAAQLAAVPLTGAAPPPRVDGKVCPIGAPNAFIDSWGFPRSGGRRHQGVDMFAAYGMPLYAVADGTITRVWNNRLGGLSVNLVDLAGDRYYYAHLSAVSVSTGQSVRAGDVIGANGNSGNARSTPPHLHWQYHPGDGPPVNPYPLARALCR